MSDAQTYPTNPNMMMPPTSGGKGSRKARKSPSKHGKKNGKRGGVDLTPFLTSLLLLGSKVVLDKRRNGVKDRRRKNYKKRVGGNDGVVETVSGTVSNFENESQSPAQELLLPPVKGGNASQMSDLVNSVLSGGKSRSKPRKGKKSKGGNNPAAPPKQEDLLGMQGGMLDFFTNKSEEKEAQEGGSRRKNSRKSKPAKKPAKKPVKKPAKKPVRKSPKKAY